MIFFCDPDFVGFVRHYPSFIFLHFTVFLSIYHFVQEFGSSL